MARTYNRPPTSDPSQIPTDRPSPVSLGNREKVILEWLDRQYVLKEKGQPYVAGKRRTIANYLNLAATTTLDCLVRLETKGFVEKTDFGAAWSITESGRKVVRLLLEGGSDGRRPAYRGARPIDRNNLSQHALRFELHVKSREFFHEEDLAKLGKVSEPLADMKNWKFLDVEIDGSILRVTPNKLVLFMKEVVDANVEATQLKAIFAAMEIANKLKPLGLFVDGIELEAAHWARVQSILADCLVKRLGRYMHQLPDGSKFWVDFSGNRAEDETDEATLRARLDSFIEDLPNAKANLSDVDGVKMDLDKLERATFNLSVATTRIAQSQAMQMGAGKTVPRDQKDLANYFG